jgi:hypothetical protein
MMCGLLQVSAVKPTDTTLACYCCYTSGGRHETQKLGRGGAGGETALNLCNVVLCFVMACCLCTCQRLACLEAGASCRCAGARSCDHTA